MKGLIMPSITGNGRPGRPKAGTKAVTVEKVKPAETTLQFQQVGVSLEPSIAAALAAEAESLYMSRSQLCRKVLSEYVKGKAASKA